MKRLFIALSLLIILPVCAMPVLQYQVQKSDYRTALPIDTWNFGRSDRYAFNALTAEPDHPSDYRFAGAPDGIYQIHLSNESQTDRLVINARRASDGKRLTTFRVDKNDVASFTLVTSSVWYFETSDASSFSGYIDG